MGKLLPTYKKEIIDEVIDAITANTSQYYAFASSPVPIVGSAANVTNDDYSTYFEPTWKMLFGKKIKTADVLPVITKNMWASNTIYDRYDNTSNTLYSNNNYYVVCAPSEVGGSYHIYKCIDNANGAASTVDPSTIGTPTQSTTFQTVPDDYKWRYVASVSSAVYSKFATDDYIPVYANSTLQAGADGYSGIDVVMIANGGSGYNCYTSGNVQGIVNSTVFQIESGASNQNDFYTNNGIYIYNSTSQTSELHEIANYYISGPGSNKFVVLATPANTTNFANGVTQYIISPYVKFTCDCSVTPSAYSTINTTSNSIHSIVILESGQNVTWANVVIQSNSSYGSGANLYAIVPPRGGHGADPVAELNVQGMVFSFSFANSEGNTITTDAVYNKIGLLKNPYVLNANNTKGSRFSTNTYNNLLKANVSPSHTFSNGESVVGNTSGARGTVVFSNSTQVWLTGDKHFSNGEYLANGSGTSVTTISINTLGDVYIKDLKPFYVQNINNVTRSNTQTESFKLVVQI